MTNMGFAEYIWLDGKFPTQGIRAKTRVVNLPADPKVTDFQEWSFDGSSTEQATGEDSDCLLAPVRVVEDAIRGAGNYLVLCEVNNPDGTPHESNQRARLRRVLDAAGPAFDPWVGFEQEYTIYRDGRPLGFPANGFPGPQGPYYCGVGADRAFGREVVERHARTCMDAELLIYGVNAEVMPGQWEFQIGYRGIEGETGDALRAADDLWLARFMLHRIAEDFGVTVSFDNKPITGDWNGAGMHTNFSTARMRDPKGGIDAIHEAIGRLAEAHESHIRHYGESLGDRLTGLHETCDIKTFRAGIADRGSSIRIPRPVATRGHGYFEDRRPGANADPYLVAARLVATVCGAPEAFEDRTSTATAIAA